jgi:small subunit ribosomal protein S21
LADVRLQEGESVENALRRFKRKVQQEDIIKEVKRHSFYLKPGEKKRVKEALARQAQQKESAKRTRLGFGGLPRLVVAHFLICRCPVRSEVFTTQQTLSQADRVGRVQGIYSRALA